MAYMKTLSDFPDQIVITLSKEYYHVGGSSSPTWEAKSLQLPDFFCAADSKEELLLELPEALGAFIQSFDKGELKSE